MATFAQTHHRKPNGTFKATRNQKTGRYVRKDSRKNSRKNTRKGSRKGTRKSTRKSTRKNNRRH